MFFLNNYNNNNMDILKEDEREKMKAKNLLISVAVQFLFVFNCCAQTNNSVVIGEQEWLIKNLDVSTFRNGDPIPEAKTNASWEISTRQHEPAWCYYNMDSTNQNKFGKLYNWYAVNDPRGIAPVGWHVPTDVEWQILVDYLGGDSSAAGKMKEFETAIWENPNTGATNKSGFTGLPGGYRYHDGFYYMGYTAFFWSSTRHTTTTAWSRLLNYDNSEVYRYFGNKWDGYSVRCVRD